MRASREFRRWMNRMRRRFGGKNGVVSGAVLDNPTMERKHAKSSKQRARRPSLNEEAKRIGE